MPEARRTVSWSGSSPTPTITTQLIPDSPPPVGTTTTSPGLPEKPTPSKCSPTHEPSRSNTYSAPGPGRRSAPMGTTKTGASPSETAAAELICGSPVIPLTLAKTLGRRPSTPEPVRRLARFEQGAVLGPERPSYRPSARQSPPRFALRTRCRPLLCNALSWRIWRARPHPDAPRGRQR